MQSNKTEEPIVLNAAAIFAVPGIHILRLRWLSNGRRLASLSELARLRTLSLVAARRSAESLRQLFASPHLRGLSSIDLHGNWADDAVASDIADGRFPDLVELWLGANRITDAGALALANSPHLKKLRVLDLTATRISSVQRGRNCGGVAAPR